MAVEPLKSLDLQEDRTVNTRESYLLLKERFERSKQLRVYLKNADNFDYLE